jgi:hypothetical protein
MSKESIQEKEQIMLSLKPSKSNIQDFPENKELVFEYIHFNQNKEGCLE